MGRVSLALRDEADLAVALVENLDREFAVHDGDDDALVPGVSARSMMSRPPS
jgi:hypothetical protein